MLAAHLGGHDNYKHRILVDLPDKNGTKYLYTNSVDLCIGLGDPNQLPESVVDPALSNRLRQKESLIYAQDGDFELKGQVVFYGGSAINAAWIAEINTKHSSTTSQFYCWITPQASSFDRAKKLNRLIFHAMTENKDRLIIGSIERIRERADGKLEIFLKDFHPYQDGAATPPEDNVIVCDQFVVSIGQAENSLIKNLRNFYPCFYTDNSNIPLGTCSADGSIITWGAAATLGIGLNQKEQDNYRKLVAMHAATFPHESQALGGIYRSYWTIRHMADQLDDSIFPHSPTHRLHDAVTPDINLATISELKEVISRSGANGADYEQYAKLIIKVRSTQKSTELSSIGTATILKNILPESIWNEIKSEYFPLENDEEKISANCSSFPGNSGNSARKHS